MNKNWSLFKEFLIIGLTTFGGGSSVVPVAHQRLIDRDQLMSEEEFLEIVTVANLLPGPSMLEIAGGIGYRVSGSIGAIISAVSVCLPSILIFIMFMLLLGNLIAPDILNHIVLPTSIILASSMLVMSFTLIKKEKFSWYRLIAIITTVVLITIFNISPIVILLITMIGIILIYGVKKWFHI